MRSTPTPYDTLRTVKVVMACARLRRMTTPSKIWMRSLSPSLILVCTLTVSPTRKSGMARRFSAFTFRCSTNSIAFARICLAPSRNGPLGVPFFARSVKFHQQFPVFIGQLVPLEQVGPLAARAEQRLPAAPAGDGGVVSAQELSGHALAAEFRRPRVVRRFQEALALERFAARAVFVAQHARQQARHRVDDGQRREFTAGE